MSQDHTPDLSKLIQAVASRDRAAFTVLFRGLAPRIKAYLLRRGLENAVAEELAQEAMLTVWRKASQFDPNHSSPEAWLFTIARNLSIDLVRRQHCAASLPRDEMPATPQADALLEAAESARQVHVAMGQLPPEQVEAIKLAFFDDYSHALIKKELGIPLGTVKTRIRTAILRLRTILNTER
jgi:RNA polymerase sigma-70 factor (ECF subfamily)